MMSALKNLLRQRPALAALPAAALLLGLWAFWGWWHSPGRAAAAFAAAVERRDTNAMIAMADPSEVKYLGLTPANVRLLLDDAARSPGGLHLLNLHEIDDGHGRVLYESVFADSTGRALPNVRSHQPGNQHSVASGTLSAYRVDGRWRLNLSDFLRGVALSRYPGEYHTLFVRHGLPDALLDQADGYWLSWEGVRVDPETLHPSSGSGTGGS